MPMATVSSPVPAVQLLRTLRTITRFSGLPRWMQSEYVLQYVFSITTSVPPLTNTAYLPAFSQLVFRIFSLVTLRNCDAQPIHGDPGVWFSPFWSHVPPSIVISLLPPVFPAFLMIGPFDCALSLMGSEERRVGKECRS